MPRILATGLALGLLTTYASAAVGPDFNSASEGVNLFTLSDVEIRDSDSTDVVVTKTLDSHFKIWPLPGEKGKSFDDIYKIFASPNDNEVDTNQDLRYYYPATDSTWDESASDGAGNFSASALTDKTNFAVVIQAPPGESTTAKTIDISENFEVQDRSAQIAIRNYDTTVSLQFAEGKTIKVGDGGQLLIRTVSSNTGGKFCKNMQLKIVLTEPIEVSEGGALYLEPRSDLTPESTDLERDMIVAPDGESAIVVSGGIVRASRFDVVRGENDSSAEPLIDVQAGELLLSSGTPLRATVDENGMPPYDGPMYEGEEFVINLDNGESSAPLIEVASGATANIDGGKITGSGSSALIVAEEGSTVTISGEDTEISSTGTAPAIEVKQGGTLTYEDSAAKITAQANDGKAVVLSGGATVNVADTTVTVAAGNEAGDYIDNHGVMVLSAGATTEDNDTLNAALVLSDGTIIEGSEEASPTYTVGGDGEEGAITVTVPAGGSVTANGKTTEMPEGGTIISTEGDIEIPANGISLNKTSVTLYSNTTPNTEMLTATLEPSNTTDTVTWSSNNKSVATVDGNGKVTAHSNGTATITATAGDQTATCTVTVKTYSSGGGSSSDDSDPTYSISAPDNVTGGSIKVTPNRASAGTRVTITVKPDSGYKLDELTVTDRKGDELKVTDRGDNKYTFQMTNSKVEIEVSFTKMEEKPTGNPFIDVAEGSWYADAVQYVYDKGLMAGTSATTFSPDATTTRGMIVTILYRLEGTPAVPGASGFTDVTAGQYYTDAVAWAAANNIVGGYGNGLFGPNDTITREQMAAILYRYAQYKGYDVTASADLSGYSDVAQVSSYALAALQWANAEGLVNGTSDTTLTPGGSATRAQVAVILMRFCENIK